MAGYAWKYVGVGKEESARNLQKSVKGRVWTRFFRAPQPVG